MIVYGAGGIGVVLLDVLTDKGIAVDWFLDASPSEKTINGVPVLPAASLCESVEQSNNILADASFDHSNTRIDREKHEMIVAIGNCDTRRTLVTRYSGPWAAAAAHPSVLISNSAEIGEGTMIFHGSIVQARTIVGKHVIVNTSANIDHDCVIGNFVHIAPHVTLCGYVNVEDGADVGASATVIPGVTIGKGAIVGAGAVVLDDIPPMSVAVGIPARVIKTRDQP